MLYNMFIMIWCREQFMRNYYIMYKEIYDTFEIAYTIKKVF